LDPATYADVAVELTVVAFFASNLAF